MKKVFFHYADKKIRINKTKDIKSVVSKIFEIEKVSFTRIDYIFCSDKYLLQLNKKLLKHNYYTDVISFTLNETKTPVIGEIYMSVDRIKDNSKKYRVLFKQELLRVLFHGTLHLCGYSDTTKKDRKLMRVMENKYLSLYENLIAVSRETIMN